jgi:3-dehydroquinate synthase/2-deoxy-scyllo-inosose synthase
MHVPLGDSGFPLVLGTEILSQISATGILPDSTHFFIVTDNTVRKIYGTELAATLNEAGATTVITHPSGERAKSMITVHRMLQEMLSAGADRSSTIIALGGGSTGNIAGLAAGLLFRGIRLIHVPTTLLAMLDSVISLKQGVNCRQVKNALGMYYAPAAIFVDVSTLRTLPVRQVRAGLCEVVKNCLVLDDGIESMLPSSSAIRMRSWDIASELIDLIILNITKKIDVLVSDPHESAAALVFEYGHTVGHALETLGGGRLPHGEAVGYGLLAAARVSQQLGLLKSDDLHRHSDLLAQIGHKLVLSREFDISSVEQLVMRDNKRGLLPGLTRQETLMVLLESIGRPRWSGTVPLVRVPLPILHKALMGLQQ